MEAYLQWKHKDRCQGARRLPRRPRRSVSCSFLQFSSLFGPKVPRVDLLGPLWIFYQRKARRVYSQKPSNRIGYPGVFCNILKLFEGYFRKRSRIWLKANGMIALVKFCKKFKVPTLPLYKFFFFQKIDAGLNEIRQTKNSSTSRSIDFTHVKWKTRSTPITMYVREFGAAWLNTDLRPFAGRAPVKSKCMGFAGYFARCICFHGQILALLFFLSICFTERSKNSISDQLGLSRSYCSTSDSSSDSYDIPLLKIDPHIFFQLALSVLDFNILPLLMFMLCHFYPKI